jgi:hypothetical protein
VLELPAVRGTVMVPKSRASWWVEVLEMLRLLVGALSRLAGAAVEGWTWGGRRL